MTRGVFDKNGGFAIWSDTDAEADFGTTSTTSSRIKGSTATHTTSAETKFSLTTTTTT